MLQRTLGCVPAAGAAALLLAACSGGAPMDDAADVADAGDINVWINAGPAATTTDAFARFEFVSMGAASHQCRLAPEPFAACESPVFLAPVAEGDHVFEVRAASGSGAAASYAWTVVNPLLSGHEDLVQTNAVPDPVAPNSWRGILRINCDFSHSSYDDPIIYPGQQGRAHLHRFYGNALVDYRTTVESLISSGYSTCQGNRLNLSAYWVPALLAPKFDPVTGTRALDAEGAPAWTVVPAVDGGDEDAHEIFYYSAAIDDLASIQPLPVGLKMIAGSAATMPGQQQDTSVVRWHCQSWESNDATNPRFSNTIPECIAPDRVRMDIFFPSCWNGVDLDASDHKSHMAYPVNSGGSRGTHCPESHPVAVVRASYHYAFGVKPEVFDPQTRSSRGWRLASDMYEVTAEQAGGLSLHADWINGWHPAIMEAMLVHCIRQRLDCHDGNLANGFRLSGTRAGPGTEPAIIHQGRGMH